MFVTSDVEGGSCFQFTEATHFGVTSLVIPPVPVHPDKSAVLNSSAIGFTNVPRCKWIVLKLVIGVIDTSKGTLHNFIRPTSPVPGIGG